MNGDTCKQLYNICTMIRQMVICTIDHTDAVDLYNDIFLYNMYAYINLLHYIRNHLL